MQYVCKNPQCKKMFLAEDVKGCVTPQTWRYCPECESNSFPVIREKPKNLKKKLQGKKIGTKNINSKKEK
jgi:hypothetical protein